MEIYYNNAHYHARYDNIPLAGLLHNLVDHTYLFSFVYFTLQTSLIITNSYNIAYTERAEQVWTGVTISLCTGDALAEGNGQRRIAVIQPHTFP